jgi:hypothetical protein
MGIISNGTTLLDAGAIDSGIASGAMVLLSTLTASNSATLDFTSGITSTYKEYMFKYINVHPSANNTSTFFGFQVDTGTNTNYAQTMTTTHFRGAHSEADNHATVQVGADRDQAEGTALQSLAYAVGGNADECISGTMSLFDPASSTFVKHFLSRANVYYEGDITMDSFTAGYVNTTTALTRVRFKMTGGNIESGIIKMYGIV